MKVGPALRRVPMHAGQSRESNPASGFVSCSEEAVALPPAVASSRGSGEAGAVAEDEVLLLVGVRRFEAETGRRAQRLQVCRLQKP